MNKDEIKNESQPLPLGAVSGSFELQIGKVSLQDLRIGNWVIVDKQGLKFEEQLLSINGYSNKFNTIQDPHYDYIYTLEPIELNAKWLVKLGCKPIYKSSKEFYIGLPNIKCELHFQTYLNTNDIVTTLKGDFTELILDRVKYVHELQNLYYTLSKSNLDAVQ